MSPAYTKGRQFENRVKRDKESHGYFVVRSAASLGPVDLVALKNGEIELIQVKVSKYSMGPDERKELKSLADAMCAKAILAYRGPASSRYKILYKEINPKKEVNHEA